MLMNGLRPHTAFFINRMQKALRNAGSYPVLPTFIREGYGLLATGQPFLNHLKK